MKLVKSSLVLSGLLFTTLTFADGTTVQLPKVKMDWRFDAIKQHAESYGYPTFSAMTNDQLKNNEGKDLRFTLNYIRLEVSGHASDTIKYKIKFRLNKKSDLSTPDVDGTSQNLDNAYIDKSFGPIYTLRVGKQALYHGGWEGYPSSRDMYSFSYAGFSSYRTGVALMAKFDKSNEIMAQVLNNKFSENNQSGLLYGFQYAGQFFNKLIQPVFSLHIDQGSKQTLGGTTPGQDASSSNSTKVTENWNAQKVIYLAFGLKSEIDNLELSADYLQNKTNGYNSKTKNVTDTSIVAFAKYTIENFKPQLKVAYSTVGTSDATKTYTTKDHRYAYHAILEYFPELNKDFSIHGGYIVDDVKPVDAARTATNYHTIDQSFVLGLKGSF